MHPDDYVMVHNEQASTIAATWVSDLKYDHRVSNRRVQSSRKLDKSRPCRGATLLSSMKEPTFIYSIFWGGGGGWGEKRGTGEEVDECLQKEKEKPAVTLSLAPLFFFTYFFLGESIFPYPGADICLDDNCHPIHGVEQRVCGPKRSKQNGSMPHLLPSENKAR